MTGTFSALRCRPGRDERDGEDQFFFIMPSSFFIPSFDMVSYFIMPSSLDMESFFMLSLDIVSFFIPSSFIILS